MSTVFQADIKPRANLAMPTAHSGYLLRKVLSSSLIAVLAALPNVFGTRFYKHLNIFLLLIFMANKNGKKLKRTRLGP